MRARPAAGPQLIDHRWVKGTDRVLKGNSLQIIGKRIGQMCVIWHQAPMRKPGCVQDLRVNHIGTRRQLVQKEGVVMQVVLTTLARHLESLAITAVAIATSEGRQMREQPSCVREREAPVASHTEASNIEAKRIEAESTTEEAIHLGVPTYALLEVTGAGAMPRRSLGSLPEKMLQVGVTILMARHMGRLDAVQLTAGWTAE